MQTKLVFRFFSYLSILIVLTSFACKTTKRDKPQNTTESLMDFLQQNESNTKAIVYNLKGASLSVSNKITLDAKTKIINGTLMGNGGSIICPPDQQCFDNVKIKGTWKRQKGYMQWFTDGKNARNNFSALTNLIAMNTEVILDNIYPLEITKYAIFDSNNDIVVKGKNPETDGFILESKPSRGQAYFKNNKGNNIHFEKISIRTRDFLKGQLPQGNDYSFVDCTYSSVSPNAKPKINHFKLLDCVIQGAVHFNYKADSKNCTLDEFKTLGIDTIQIKNCQIEQEVILLALRNAPYKKVEISKNIVNDLLGPVFFFPISGMAATFNQMAYQSRDYMLIEENKVENKKTLQGRQVGGYMALVVAKGNDFTVINNSFKNILNTIKGIETTAFYCSAVNHLIVKKNKILNCGSKGLGLGNGANCLLKLKGALNCDITDNEFRFDRKALQALGLISNTTDNLSTISSANFRFSLLGSEKRNVDSTHYYRFENNIFEAAVISDYSWVSRANFIFKNNQVSIDHILTADPNQWGGNLAKLDHTLLYFSTPIKNGNIAIEDNEVFVKNMDGKIFYFTFNQNDNKQYKKVSYQNNTFMINGIVSLFYPRADLLICKNELKGKGSFIFNEASSLKKNRTIKELRSEQLVKEYYSGYAAPYHLKNFGTSVIKAEQNKDDRAMILQIGLNDLYYYNEKDKLPISLEVEALLTTRDKKEKRLSYRIVFESYNRAHFLEERSNKIKFVQPYWNKKIKPFQHFLHPINGKPDSTIRLALSSQSRERHQNNTGFLILQGLQNVSSFEIKASVKKLDASNETNKKSIISRYLKKKL